MIGLDVFVAVAPPHVTQWRCKGHGCLTVYGRSGCNGKCSWPTRLRRLRRTRKQEYFLGKIDDQKPPGAALTHSPFFRSSIAD